LDRAYRKRFIVAVEEKYLTAKGQRSTGERFGALELDKS
jgi:hypothetical protein